MTGRLLKNLTQNTQLFNTYLTLPHLARYMIGLSKEIQNTGGQVHGVLVYSDNYENCRLRVYHVDGVFLTYVDLTKLRRVVLPRQYTLTDAVATGKDYIYDYLSD